MSAAPKPRVAKRRKAAAVLDDDDDGGDEPASLPMSNVEKAELADRLKKVLSARDAIDANKKANSALAKGVAGDKQWVLKMLTGKRIDFVTCANNNVRVTNAAAPGRVTLDDVKTAMGAVCGAQMTERVLATAEAGAKLRAAEKPREPSLKFTRTGAARKPRASKAAAADDEEDDDDSSGAASE